MYHTSRRKRNFEHVSGALSTMDSHFISALSKLKLNNQKLRRDDDLVDRFSHTFSTLLLFVFTLIISARQYIGKPIACWVPTEFTRAQEEYAENVCWVTNTYFLPTDEPRIPQDIVSRDKAKIGYYQWVPFILLLQAFFFTLPCLIWRLFNWQSGIQLSNIMEVACDVEMIKDPISRETSVRYVAKHIEDALSAQREYRSGCAVHLKHFLARNCFFWFGKRYGNFLVCLYLICKICYVANIVGQFFLMNKYLGTTYTFYGVELLRDLIEGHAWEQSGNFPRITLCDFEIRKLANIHRYTVQCVLPINMFNEKIYIFFWFWLILMSVFSISSFFFWAYKSALRSNRTHFVRKFLKLREILEPGDKTKSFHFVDNYLRQDGVFIIRLIAQNAGELVAAEVCESLWCMYKSRGSVAMNLSMPNDTHAAASLSANEKSSKRGDRRTGAANVTYNSTNSCNTQPLPRSCQPPNHFEEDAGEFV